MALGCLHTHFPGGCEDCSTVCGRGKPQPNSYSKGPSGTCSTIQVAALLLQMAALQAANRGRVVSVPAALVTECMECLEEMATADLQVGRGTCLLLTTALVAGCVVCRWDVATKTCMQESPYKQGAFGHCSWYVHVPRHSTSLRFLLRPG